MTDPIIPKDDEGLLPCPFCGIGPMSGTSQDIGFVQCMNLQCVGPSVSRTDRGSIGGFVFAAKIWNTRAPSPGGGEVSEDEVERSLAAFDKAVDWNPNDYLGNSIKERNLDAMRAVLEAFVRNRQSATNQEGH